MWLIPLLLTLAGSPIAGLLAGAAVGATHGALRGLGVTYNTTRLGADVHCALFARFGWRLADGLTLLFLASYGLTATLI
jgi:hypothetical protein